MAELTVRVVGTFNVLRHDGARIKFKSRKSEALLAILLFCPDGICPRATLKSLLWSTRSEKQKRNSLAKELVVLKAALGRASPGLVQSDRRHVVLDLSRVDVLDAPKDGWARATLLDGLEVFDSPAFKTWLRDLRAEHANGRLATDGAQNAVSPGTHALGVANTSPVNPIEFRSDPGLCIEIAPVTTRAIQAPDFANDVAQYNVNRLADTMLRSLFQCDYWDIRDGRGAEHGATPLPGRGTHTVSISAYIYERCLEFQIVLRDPNNLTIWVNPKFSCDIASQKVFSYFDDVCATLLEFLLSYAQRIQNGQPWKTELQLSEVFDGLFVPGSKPISEINVAVDKLISFEPSGINISLRNCARMLQFGERLDGYDCVTNELVRHDLRRALELAPSSALAHSVASHAFSMFLGNHDAAIDYARRSVELQPQNEIYVAFLALALLRADRPEDAAACLKRARMLTGNPKYKGFMDAVTCACLTTGGAFEEAAAFGESALTSNPKFNATKKYLFASYAHLGDYPKAQRLADEIATVDRAFGYGGIVSEESPVNVKPAVPILSNAARLVGVF